MPSKTPKSSENVEFEIELDPTSGKIVAKGRIPQELPQGAGRGLTKAAQFVFAAAFPRAFRRGSDETLLHQIKKTHADKICKDIDDPDNRELASFLLLSGLKEQAHKMERRSKIIEGAATELDLISNRPEFSESGRIISDEFLFHFWDTADRISQEDMREIFEKILAGEIVSPGSYSAATLNLLSTLHPELAQKFQTFCNMTFNFDSLDFLIVSIPRAEHPEITHNSISSSRAIGEYLVDFGISREDLYDLHSAGLIRSRGGEEFPDLTRIYNSDRLTFAGKKAWLDEKEEASKKPGFSIYDSVSVISLPPSGSEIRSVISLEPHESYLRKLKDVMKIAGISMTI